MARYRRYRRSYRRKLRRRVPRSLGTSGANFMKASFNVEQTMQVPWAAGNYYPNFPISISPFWGSFGIVEGDVAGGRPVYADTPMATSGRWWISPYLASSFRKMCTIYGEYKCDGISIAIVPLDWGAENGTGPDMLTVYTVWDRKLKEGGDTQYRPDQGQNGSRRIKEASSEQSARQTTFSTQRGRMTHWTKISARTTVEKSQFIDTKTRITVTNWARDTTAQQNQYQYISMYNAGTENDTITCFHPACFMSFEGDKPSPANHFFKVKIKCRFHFTFRTPGVTGSTVGNTRILLLPNEDLIPANQLTAPWVPFRQRDEEEEERALAYEARRGLTETLALPLDSPIPEDTTDI